MNLLYQATVYNPQNYTHPIKKSLGAQKYILSFTTYIQSKADIQISNSETKTGLIYYSDKKKEIGIGLSNFFAVESNVIKLYPRLNVILRHCFPHKIKTIKIESINFVKDSLEFEKFIELKEEFNTMKLCIINKEQFNCVRSINKVMKGKSDDSLKDYGDL